MPQKIICHQPLNVKSEYQEFVVEVNDVLYRVPPFESTVLLGSFNAHIGNMKEYDWKAWSNGFEREQKVSVRALL